MHGQSFHNLIQALVIVGVTVLVLSFLAGHVSRRKPKAKVARRGGGNTVEAVKIKRPAVRGPVYGSGLCVCFFIWLVATWALSHVTDTHRAGLLSVVLLLGVVGAALKWSTSREMLTEVQRKALTRRRIQQVAHDSGIPELQVHDVQPILSGDLIEVQMPKGRTVRELEGVSEVIAGYLDGVHDVRVERMREAGHARLYVVRQDPFEHMTLEWPGLRDESEKSGWDPVPIGVDRNGLPISIKLVERNWMIGGEPGSGKSVTLHCLLGHLSHCHDVKLWLMDGKNLDLPFWEPLAHRYVGMDRKKGLALLDELLKTAEGQMAKIGEDFHDLKIRKRHKLPLHYLVIDELPYFVRKSEDKITTGKNMERIRDCVARLRAAGVIVVVAIQRPSAETVDTDLRDLISWRLALRCNTTQSSDMILGQGWATAGYNASDIESDDNHKGVGYLLADGSKPIKMKGYLLSADEEEPEGNQVAQVVSRAVQLKMAREWQAAGT